MRPAPRGAAGVSAAGAELELPGAASESLAAELTGFDGEAQDLPGLDSEGVGDMFQGLGRAKACRLG